MSSKSVLNWLIVGIGLGVHGVYAQSETGLSVCKAIDDETARLTCYDRVVERAATAPQSSAQRVTVAAAAASAKAAATAADSLLDKTWELFQESKQGTFNIKGYAPSYALPVFVSSNQNRQPTTANAETSVTTRLPAENMELKFQLSAKVKTREGVFGDYGDLWLGYTQSSRWQAYSQKQSNPFRETNYEAEALLVFLTHYQLFGWNGRLLGIGVNHQSNGRADPLSRSWNRVIANIGFERKDWVVMLRPWWRIPEGGGQDDDNPQVEDYIGRAEAQIIHNVGDQQFSLILRHSLRGGDNSRGSARMNWSFPLIGRWRGYAELFKGYGESLIDYNHNATYVGLGVSLVDWY